MNRNGKVAGLIGGLLGVAASSAAVAGLVRVRKRTEDPYVDEPLGELEPSRSSTVAADDGVPLSVEEVDPEDGGPAELTVLFVHGFALSRRSWHFQRKRLAKLRGPRTRLVLYDHRGHGRSGRALDDSARIEQLAADLAAVIRAVAAEGPLMLVGHSMGGMTIMELARTHPEWFAERVPAVALIATSAGDIGARGLPRPALSPRNPVPKGVGKLAEWQPGFVELVRTAGDSVTRRLARQLSFGPGEVSPSIVRFMTEMLAVTSVAELTEFLGTLHEHNRYAALAGLRHSSVLVLSGDADRLLGFEHAERIAAELPDAELVRVDGAGHMVQLERPDLVNEHLLGLVRRANGNRPGRKPV